MLLEGTDMDPSTRAHELVIVRNYGRRALTLRYSGQTITVPCAIGGGEPEPVAIPYLAMCLWFGNPLLRDLSDVDMDKRHRTRERERLAAKYGFGAMGEDWYIDPTSDPDASRRTSRSFYEGMDPVAPYEPVTLNGRPMYRHPNLPAVTCHTFDNKRIITVLDDPEGNLTFPEQTGSANRSEVEELRANYEALRGQLLAVVAAMGQTNPDAAREMAANMPPRITPEPAIPTFDGNVDALQTALADLTNAAGPAIADDAAATASPLGAADGMSDAVAGDPVPTKRARVHKPA